MNIEVDQSRKVEQTGPTVLAFSNDEQGALLVPAAVKREILRRLREQGRKKRSSVHMVFAALVALLLGDVLKQGVWVTIDKEYPGHDARIRSQVLVHLCRLGVEATADMITFGPVGKASTAHHLANSVYRGEGEPDRCATVREVWGLLGYKARKARGPLAR